MRPEKILPVFNRESKKAFSLAEEKTWGSLKAHPQKA
jgi:hypothetical protein